MVKRIVKNKRIINESFISEPIHKIRKRKVLDIIIKYTCVILVPLFPESSEERYSALCTFRVAYFRMNSFGVT